MRQIYHSRRCLPRSRCKIYPKASKIIKNLEVQIVSGLFFRFHGLATDVIHVNRPLSIVLLPLRGPQEVRRPPDSTGQTCRGTKHHRFLSKQASRDWSLFTSSLILCLQKEQLSVHGICCSGTCKCPPSRR